MFDRLLHAAVARASAESTLVRELLEQLEGRQIALHLQGTPLRVRIVCSGGDLTLSPLQEADAAVVDATVRGSPLALLSLATADEQSVVGRGDVQVEGSTHVVQQFRDLVRQLRPDLEPLLGELTGRSIAHILMRGLRGAADWTRSAAWTQAQNVAEYLAHERGHLVPRAEAEGFLRGVDEARDHMERIAARLRQLESRA